MPAARQKVSSQGASRCQSLRRPRLCSRCPGCYRGPTMPETTDCIAHMADPVVTALATVAAVKGVVCFGSYALGTWDAASDLDLYVICDPTIMPETTRHCLFARISGITALHFQYVTPGWRNAWAPHVDRVTVEPFTFDLAYTTHAWITHVVHRVRTEGALTLPEMPFRIGPSAFLLHLGRVCDAMVSILY